MHKVQMYWNTSYIRVYYMSLALACNVNSFPIVCFCTVSKNDSYFDTWNKFFPMLDTEYVSCVRLHCNQNTIFPFSISAKLNFTVNILCRSFVSLFFMRETSAATNFMAWAILKASQVACHRITVFFECFHYLTHTQLYLVMHFLKMSKFASTW